MCMNACMFVWLWVCTYVYTYVSMNICIHTYAWGRWRRVLQPLKAHSKWVFNRSCVLNRNCVLNRSCVLDPVFSSLRKLVSLFCEFVALGAICVDLCIIYYIYVYMHIFRHAIGADKRWRGQGGKGVWERERDRVGCGVKETQDILKAEQRGVWLLSWNIVPGNSLSVPQ